MSEQVAYPYGIHIGLQSWILEREYLYGLVNGLLGPGPWLQWYMVASTLLTGLGSFLLLRTRYSVARSAAAAFALSFLCFNTTHRYPTQMNIGATHWLNLNLIADFLCCRRAYEMGRIPLQWILLRAVLLMAALGGDISYLAGYALVSFSLSLGFTILVGRRRATNFFDGLKSDLLTHPIEIGLLAIVFLCLCWLYLPICMQLFWITRDYKSYAGAYWTNPIRLLFPWLPFLDLASPSLNVLLSDHYELPGAFSPGWTLMSVGICGAVYAGRRRFSYYLPLGLLFLLCISYHPDFFPILKIFPWCSTMRVVGRSTVLLPTVLCLFALAIPSPSRKLSFFSACLAVLAAAEFTTSFFWYKRFPLFEPNDDFYRHIDLIKNTPGEAILDWPFCIRGGYGLADLCPQGSATASDYALGRLHHKKVVGFTSGRLAPEMAQVFYDHGWEKLLDKATKCFNEAEWREFTEFYKKHAFAGIQLHTDFFPEACRDEFIKRFGKVESIAQLPGSGTAWFIPNKGLGN